MKKQMLTVATVLMLIASPAAAQVGSTTKDGKTVATTSVKTDENQNNPRFVRTLTNVQIEFTLTDQIGTAAPEKKVVSMIASTGNWGKVRSGSMIIAPGGPPYSVVLNVDARPFVSTDGLIQLEMTLVYEPVMKGEGDNSRTRPSGINQSQTVVLQSGKPLVVSQAADPVSDRKVVVEVKATVLK